MTQKEQEAFNAGYRASAAGVLRDANPHPHDSPLWLAWDNGWDDAADDYPYED